MADFAERYKHLADERRMWAIVPGKKDSYVAAFEGTFPEAIAEATAAAAFYKSTVVVWETDSRHYRRQGWMVRPWVEVRVPKESPVRNR